MTHLILNSYFIIWQNMMHKLDIDGLLLADTVKKIYEVYIYNIYIYTEKYIIFWKYYIS